LPFHGQRFLLIHLWLIVRSPEPVVLRFELVFLLVMVLNPIVVSLQKHHIPRLTSVILPTTSEDSREQRAAVVVQTRTIERRYREAEMFPFNSKRRRSKHGDQRSGLHPLQKLIARFHSLRSDRRALRSQDIFLNFAGRSFR